MKFKDRLNNITGCFFSKSVKNYVVFIVLLYLPLIIKSSKEEIMSEKVLEIKIYVNLMVKERL